MENLKKQKVPFTQIPNSIFNDNTLSFAEKGLWGYLFSKPTGWEFSSHRIVSETKETAKAVQRNLTKLEEKGLLKRTKLKSGKMVYEVLYKPEVQNIPLAENINEKPEVQNGSEHKRLRDETYPISNTDSYKEINIEQEINKNTIATRGVAVDISKEKNDVNVVMELFQMNINPIINYGNKAQRKAIEEMINFMGIEKLLNTLEYYLTIKDEPFAPTITTPYQLKSKLAQLIQFAKRKQNQPVKGITIT
jgi:hypothetical protein